MRGHSWRSEDMTAGISLSFSKLHRVELRDKKADYYENYFQKRNFPHEV